MGVRLRAFILDYVLFLCYAAVLGGTAVLFPTAIQSLFGKSAASDQLWGFTLLTLPVVLYFAITESSARQGTWGKQRLGLRVVDRLGCRIGFGRGLVRAAVKFVPWELGHYAVWQFYHTGGDPPAHVMTVLIAVYVLLAVYLALPFVTVSRRSVFDFVAGTRVEISG
jgi:uncharacterized RDD family membrane protein YckC